MFKKLTSWLKNLTGDFRAFISAYFSFFRQLALDLFHRFEAVKNFLAALLYRQRGRWAQPFAHFWLALFLFLGIALSPSIEENLRHQDFEWNSYSPSIPKKAKV